MTRGLDEVLERARDVPFWRRKLDGAREFAEIPPTTKDELRASEAEHPPWGDYRANVRDVIRVGTSTGTSGEPTIVLWTRHDLDVECEAAARMFSRLGMRPGLTVAHAHPLGLYGGGFLQSEVLERFGCTTIALGTPDDPERIVRFLARTKPDVYQLFPNVALKLWETAERMGLDPRADLNMRYPKERPQAQYASASAGIECMAYLGSACREFNGAHVADDLCLVEVVDPATGERVPDGVRGHLVCTSFAKDNFLLRYDLEDVARIDHAPCPCGESSPRVFWDGRASDAVRVNGREILPIDVWSLLGSVEYQIVRVPDGALHVRVEGDHDRVALEAGLMECLGVPAEVEVVPGGALPRPEFKPVRVVEV